MSKSKQDLNHLLFSQSHHDQPDQNQFHGNFKHMNYEDVDQCQNNYDFAQYEQNQKDSQNLQFYQYNGHSVEFNQNVSQNSVMMHSSRQEDDSRQYRNERDKKMQRLLDMKKDQEILFNEALERQLTSFKQQLQKSKFQITKMQAALKGSEIRISKKDDEILKLQKNILQLQNQIQKLSNDKEQCLKALKNKDDFFCQLRQQISKLFSQVGSKSKQIDDLRLINNELSEQIEKLNRNLAVYIEPDRKLYDFKGFRQQYQSPVNSKKNPNLQKIQKELEKLKVEKNSIEIDYNAIKRQLQRSQNKVRQLEEQNHKKNVLKDKKIQDLQQKLSQLKDDNLKNKSQLETNIEKINSNLNFKLKQINSLNDKIAQSEKRIKSLLDESKKKDEKVRDLTMQILDKNKLINERNKQLEDMRIKQEFDHHLVTEKDEQIELLTQEKKLLVQQLDQEKLDKREKVEKIDKTEKIKRERDQEKQKKQFETLKKNYEALEKEKQQLLNTSKEAKRKLEQMTKQLKTFKSTCSEFQTTIKNKDMQAQLLKEKAQKAIKELNETKKKTDLVPQLKNKIIILENRLKQNETIMRQSCDLSQSSNLLDKIEALEAKLYERDQELKSLKGIMKANSMQTSDEHDEDLEYLEMELTQKEKFIDKLSQQLQEKQQIIDKLNRDLAFKDSTLDFTHKVLVNSEKEKIQLQQEKKILEEMINNSGYDGSKKQIEFYDEQVEILQNKIYQLEKRLRDQEEIQRQKEYDNRQLKLQVKEYKEALLTRQKKITPETMSQEETVTFLTKTIKKVNRSADMLRLLAKNRQLKDLIMKMYQELRSIQESR